MKTRPHFIKHWQLVEPKEPVTPPIMDEVFGFAADIGTATGLSRLRVIHVRLRPGERSNPPIALRDEEEFFFVLEGAPDLWNDGHLHRLKEGDGVSMIDGTGIGRAFLNNTDKPVRLFVLGEGSRYATRARHPHAIDAKANETLGLMGKLWDDAPKRKLGPHDGLTDAKRGSRSPERARKSRKPAFVTHWRDILGKDRNNSYPGSEEQHGVSARFGREVRFSRLGIHLEILKPGRRTSWPHAERDEEELVFVVSGKVDAWIDGYIHPMAAGDFVGFASRTGIAHVIINNSDEDAILLVGGEASRARNQYFYPLNPRQNKAIGENHWHDQPKHKLGPHDGMPDALRAGLGRKIRRVPRKKTKRKRS